jgi:hypothetical protein
MALVVRLAAGIALAEIRVGTDNPETLTGTNSADLINGQGGNDTLKGLAGNDTYYFDDGFGDDTLIETATVKVGKKKRPGGIDTLNFSNYSVRADATLMPELGQGFNNVDLGSSGTPNTDNIDLGSSPVENVVGGSSFDYLRGGSAKNTYMGGPGGSDDLTDFGGDDGSGVFGNAALPDLPASDDTYKGFTSGIGGGDNVRDYGGTADRLDLRPFESSDVFVTAFDSNFNGTNDTLYIGISANAAVRVYGHFVPTEPGQGNGRMEQIIFANETITSTAELNSLM